MNRRKFLSYVGCGCCGFVLNSCATAPITERKQLKIVSEAKLNAQAAQIFEKIKEKEKMSKDTKSLNQIKEIGKSLDFDFNFSKTKRIPNTFNAHRLLWKSKEYGIQTEMSEALFAAYFTDGQDIGSQEVLAEIAEKVGMDKGKILEFLSSKEGGQETADEEMAFIEKSIGAVPTYFINDKYIIQGGQEPETFISFLDKIILKEKENADSR